MLACIGFAGATNVCLQSLTNFSCRLCSPDTGTLLNTSREKWQVVTTGHSLGAGVAVLIAARLREVVAGVQALPIQKDKEVLRPQTSLVYRPSCQVLLLQHVLQDHMCPSYQCFSRGQPMLVCKERPGTRTCCWQRSASVAAPSALPCQSCGPGSANGNTNPTSAL